MERCLVTFHLECKTFMANRFMNSCPFLMNVPGSFIDAFYPLDNFIDHVSQCIWRRDRFVPDGILSSFGIGMPLTIDVDVEFESNIVIQACKNHAIRYCSSPDFSAFDHLESFDYFVEYVHGCMWRRRWQWKMRFRMLQRATHWWSFWTGTWGFVDYSLN